MRWWDELDNVKRTVVRLSALVAVMASLTALAVPFYSWFCAVTGFGGETSVAAGESETILEKTIKVRFDANTERGFAWDFKPEVREMELRIGETGLVFYEAHNPTDRPVAGQASYNVAPFSAGGYFTKIACFCFELQVLQPGETLMMPVTFYVDPEIVDDIEAKYVRTITLSYTFHPADLPEAETEEDVTDASAVLPRAQDVN
ncbi:cytochrome c oxidase assembly protein subunit 11 [Albimonas donghaensis]|uniref:Cytochrome c oxidase assembly protein CtaG n=1 Tax=Albimonas donghaensis TaxID=356660 RepID=A0A1H2VQ75_9RHOB|nr:cytochrome c oxidase assembly protein [Albimonas donghaensis]SDW70505.1 cytochrome c oxidase assembly protein subunit 11 [Albimonas donghaensis]